MIEDPEEQHDVEGSQLACRELIHVERQVLDFGADEFLRFVERVERDAVDRDHLSAAALAFETEPAIPRADIEDTLAAQILWQAEEIEPPAQVFDCLEARKHAAIRQFDRMI